MNTQEIYNKVARHLLVQGKRSMSDIAEGCAYRGDEGRMCAVGCLISDDVYDVKIEGYNFRHDDVRGALSDSGIEINYPNVSLLTDLQKMHDSVEPDEWKEYLNVLAVNHNLEPLKD